MDAAFKSFFLVCIIVLAVLTFFCLVRTIKGPRLVDRILDICLIYAIMSFVAVIVLTKIYIGIYNEKKSRQSRIEEESQDEY